MEEFQTGAVRDTGGKGRMDLLPWSALIRISKHMEDAILPDPDTGKPHYPERNWEKGIPMHSMIDSAFRHLAKYIDGWTDEDHLCAAATNLLMALWTEEHRPEMQDIPSRSFSVVPPLRSDGNAGTTGHLTEEAQENAEKRVRKLCSCWDVKYDAYDGYTGICRGTREEDSCLCNGDERQCDFYENMREKASDAEYRQAP